MAAEQTADKSIAATDVVISVALPFLFALSWCLPTNSWQAVSRAFARLIPMVFGQSERSLIERVQALMGQQYSLISADNIVRDYYAAHIERKLLTLRMHRPGQWIPSIMLSGREHIDAGLSQGNGVVLWDSHFAFAGLITKIALSHSGISVSHLSQRSHGFDSGTEYGIRALNPLIWSIEARYLRERVELSLDSSTLAMRTLMRRLRKNNVVSITVRDNDKNTHRYPFLNGTLGIGSGAPFLAAKTGAILLPVFTLRSGDGSYQVTVDSPIVMSSDVSAKERIQHAVLDYLQRLVPYVLQQPGQWLSWSER